MSQINCLEKNCIFFDSLLDMVPASFYYGSESNDLIKEFINTLQTSRGTEIASTISAHDVLKKKIADIKPKKKKKNSKLKNNGDCDDDVSKNNYPDNQNVGLGDLQQKLKNKILNIQEIQKEKTNLANQKFLLEMKNPRRAEKKEDQKSTSEEDEQENGSISEQETQNNEGSINMELTDYRSSNILKQTKKKKKIRKEKQPFTNIPEDMKDKLFKIQKRAKKRMDQANEKFLLLKKTKGLTQGVGLQHIQEKLKKEIEEIQEEAKKKRAQAKQELLEYMKQKPKNEKKNQKQTPIQDKDENESKSKKVAQNDEKNNDMELVNHQSSIISEQTSKRKFLRETEKLDLSHTKITSDARKELPKKKNKNQKLMPEVSKKENKSTSQQDIQNEEEPNDIEVSDDADKRQMLIDSDQSDEFENDDMHNEMEVIGHERLKISEQIEKKKKKKKKKKISREKETLDISYGNITYDFRESFLQDKLDYKPKAVLSKRDLFMRLTKEQQKVKNIGAYSKKEAEKRQLSTDYTVAMNKISGRKVLDNASRLRKVLRKKRQRKKKSEIAWKARKGAVAKSMKDKQVKRRKNIAERHLKKTSKKKNKKYG